MDTTMSDNVQYAGFWSRFWASIIDSIWLFGIIYTIIYLWSGPQFFTDDVTYSPIHFTLEWIVPIFVILLFWVVKSATPGKMLLGIKIVDADNYQPVPAGRLLLRYVGYYISMIPLCLGFFWVGWDKRKQGWHDKIARTVLIKEG